MFQFNMQSKSFGNLTSFLKTWMFCDFATYQISNILRIFRVLERREETNSKSFLVKSCDFLMNVTLRIQLNNALKCSILKLYALIKFVLQWGMFVDSFICKVCTQKYINYDVISTINHCTAATFKFKLK